MYISSLRNQTNSRVDISKHFIHYETYKKSYQKMANAHLEHTGKMQKMSKFFQ